MFVRIVAWKIYIILVFILVTYFSFQAFNIYSSITVTKPLANKRVVVIDPGHGGIDGGTSYNNLLEKDINIEVALKLKDYFKKNSNIEVIMTREEDIALDHLSDYYSSRHLNDLKSRIDIINQSKVDLFISLHIDYRASQTYMKGPTVLYSSCHAQNKALAQTLQKYFNQLSTCYSKRNPKRRKDLYILKAHNTPGVIVELGFFSNAKDRTLLEKDSYQDKLVEKVYLAIEEYFSAFKFISY